MGGVEISWDHDIFLMWFVFGIPIGFIIASLMIRGASSSVGDFLKTGWPAIAPIAGWTLLAQALHQSDTFLGRSIALTAIVWIFGTAAIALILLRRPGIGHLLTGSALATVLVGALSSSVAPDLDRPNALIETASPDSTPIILLTVDTLRRDALSIYGSQTPTPALDALAADGVVFDRAYSTAPWTYVSFPSIHSGLTPWGHGVRHAEDRILPLASALASTLRDQGYNTAAIGTNGLLRAAGLARNLALGFDDREFFPRSMTPRTRAQFWLQSVSADILGLDASTQQISDYGSEWVRNHKSAPFLLWLHFFDPHSPYEFVEDYPPVYEPSARRGRLSGESLESELQSLIAPGERERSGAHNPRYGRRVRGLSEWARALYQSEVQTVDRAIGEFVQTLKEEGIYDRALIVFTSDHGEEFLEHNQFHHGQTLYNELVRVPLLLKLPGSSTKLRLSQPVSTVAIAPTIFDLASIPYQEDMYSARSLRSTWQDPSPKVARKPSPPVFMTGVRGEEPAEAVVWENYKLIRWENLDHEELYEFKSDPNELYNLALQMPEQVAIGRALLADHAVMEAKRAAARGFKTPAQEPLTPGEEEILRGLGYLR